MKEPNKKPSTNCDDIEQLLIKRNIDELAQDENLVVEKHLKFCERCQSYQNTLLSLENSMQIGAEEKLVADPAIRQSIIRRMKTVKPEGIGIFQSGWQYIRTALEYRIPVYQTLLIVALIPLIFFAVNQLFLTPDREPTNLQGVAQMEPLVSAQMRVIDNLQMIDQQRIGRTVKEDPGLTRFIVTAR